MCINLVEKGGRESVVGGGYREVVQLIEEGGETGIKLIK